MAERKPLREYLTFRFLTEEAGMAPAMIDAGGLIRSSPTV
jgi:hypothetical protein